MSYPVALSLELGTSERDLGKAAVMAFYSNDDDGGDVRDVAMVEVIGSSPVCPRGCLGWFAAAKSKLQWRVPVACDDGK